MERDRLKLREALKTCGPAEEVQLDLGIITDQEVLDMHVEEIKLRFGAEIPIHFVLPD